MSIIQGTSKAAGGGYEIDQSIRFNFSDAAHMLRTPSSASNRRTWTWSLWVKRSGLGNPGGPNQVHQLFGVGAGSCLRFTSADVLRLESPAGNHTFVTSQVFRDTSAWYHIVLAFDSTQATDTNRRKLYVNGSQVTDFSSTTFTELGQNAEWDINSTSQHQIAKSNLADHFGGYLAELNFIDGTALDPTSFGEYNDDGVWIPKAYDGSYGTNGFYITGETASDLGEDFSGNGNDWTSSGLATTDQMLDTPTDNYCVLSPIDKSSAITTSDGNLVVSNASTNSWNHGRGTLFAPSGKWYYEWIPTAGSYALAGWMLNVSGNDYVEEESDVATTFYRGVGAAGRGFYIGSGSADTGPANFSLNDVVMMAIDVDTMKMWVGVNGTWYNSGDPAAGSNATGTWTAAIGESVAPWYGCFNGTTESFNFGQRPFAHTIPTGFNSWNTANLVTPSIKDGSAHFQPFTYASTGTSTAFVQDGNSQFEPGLVWVKSRTGANNHLWFDQVRGATKFIRSDTTDVENTVADTLTSFNSNGFTAGADSSNWGINYPGRNNVAWQWKANGSGSSNTDGSLSSTVSANTTAGFSIVTYVGNSTSGATVGHGLGAVPKMMILKDRDVAENWCIYHDALGPTKFLFFTTDAAFTVSNRWNDTAPTSSVFTLGNETQVNATGRDYVVYCFAEIPGYSSIGSYEGNGSTDGPFVYTGFRPSFLLVKNIDAVDSWQIRDSKRDPFNVSKEILYPNTSGAEATSGGGQFADLLSNGFKWRGADGGNNSAATFIYMAFAENPFGGDGVAPATAR